MDTEDTIQATEVSLRVLEEVATLDSAGVTQLSNRLDIPTSTVHIHLETLKQNEYLVKEDGKYHLGCRFLDLGIKARNHHSLYSVARESVDELAEQTGEISGLMIEEHGRGAFLYRSTGNQAVHLDTHSGKQVYLHTTALGKAIMAYLPEERVEEILDQHGLPAQTEHTITDRDELLSELAEVRESGIAFTDEERIPKLRSVAVPIRANGQVLGSMSVAGPKSRFRGDVFREEIPNVLRRHVDTVEFNLTYS